MRATATLLAAVLLSCGGAPASRTAPASPTGVAKTPTAPSPESSVPTSNDDWARSSWEERHDTMEFVVHPSMARLFQEHDRKSAPDMTCRTCHGADAEAVQYKMPHGLPALDPAHLPDPSGSDARAKTAKFMIDEVTPKMVDLLEVTPYDPKTKRGFGCFNCHPVSR